MLQFIEAPTWSATLEAPSLHTRDQLVHRCCRFEKHWTHQMALMLPFAIKSE